MAVSDRLLVNYGRPQRTAIGPKRPSGTTRPRDRFGSGAAIDGRRLPTHSSRSNRNPNVVFAAVVGPV